MQLALNRMTTRSVIIKMAVKQGELFNIVLRSSLSTGTLLFHFINCEISFSFMFLSYVQVKSRKELQVFIQKAVWIPFGMPCFSIKYLIKNAEWKESLKDLEEDSCVEKTWRTLSKWESCSGVPLIGTSRSPGSLLIHFLRY